MKTRGRMHQTTVRFTDDLWEQLEREAARTGVSAAQYVRDATLARLAYTAAQRGEAFSGGAPAPPRVQQASDGSREARADSTAVWAQARLARQQAQSVRGEARAVQTQTRQLRTGGAPDER